MTIPNKQKVHVGLLIFSLQKGGAESNILNFIRFVDRDKIIPYVFSIKANNDYEKDYPQLKKDIISLLPNSKIPLFLKPLMSIVVFIKLFQSIRNYKIDVLVAGAEYLPFYLTTLVSFITNVRTILIVGNNISEELSRKNICMQKINYLLFKISFMKADHIIAVSHGLARSIKKTFRLKNHLSVIYNGLDLEYIRTQSQKKMSQQMQKVYEKNRIVVSMGRLAEKKNFPLLIRSFYEIKKSLPHIKLVLIGKGDMEKCLKNLVSELELTKDVFFMGDHPDKYAFIAKADVFVFTSLYEGFGNVIVEAMACGTPIVSTDCDFGPREILENDCGILTSMDSDAIAKHVVNLLMNNKIRTRYSTQSLKRSHFFPIEKMVEEYTEMITALS